MLQRPDNTDPVWALVDARMHRPMPTQTAFANSTLGCVATPAALRPLQRLLRVACRIDLSDEEPRILCSVSSGIFTARRLRCLSASRELRCKAPGAISPRGWPMAYLVAMVMMVLGLWGLANTYISHTTKIATSDAIGCGTPANTRQQREGLQLSGRSPAWLTANGHVLVEPTIQGATIQGATVALGQRYALASGLMENHLQHGGKGSFTGDR